ncbi:MAG: M48 family metallopeptidase [Legionellales bacterium]
MNIEIDGIPIEIIRKRIKNLNLRIYPPHGLVKISVPLGYNEQLIYKHLQDKIPWINTQRQRIQARPFCEGKPLQTGSNLEFLGKNYLLIIEEHHGPSQFQIKDQLIHCFMKPLASPAQKLTLLDNWYRREMGSILPELINHWQAIVGVKVNEWGIKKMKTRWGSCNTRLARIWLNLNLIKKPLVCLEYVLVHELVHLLEASHNRRFYALMTQFMPQWREYQKDLEK